LAPIAAQAKDGAVHVLASASMGDHVAEQRLIYRRKEGRWMLVDAVITRQR